MSIRIEYLTDVQKSNLATLAEYLEKGTTAMTFDMGNFCTKPVADRLGDMLIRPVQHKCGTAGCAVGHGPAAGMNAKADENWHNYCYRVFGVKTDTVPMIAQAFHWMFGSSWTDVDNTPQGAAKRIRFFLEHGVPYDWRAQMNGDAPLCYK